MREQTLLFNAFSVEGGELWKLLGKNVKERNTWLLS